MRESGDLGDFASFVTHMKQLALEKDVDLLLVDSGDLHDGTGLSDGFPPGDVDGHDVSAANMPSLGRILHVWCHSRTSSSSSCHTMFCLSESKSFI